MHQTPKPSAAAVQTQLSRLTSLRRTRSHRDRTGLFVIEGIREFIRACDAGFQFDTLFVSRILLRHSGARQLVRRLDAGGFPKSS